MNLFKIPANELTVENLKTIRQYVAAYRNRADRFRPVQDPAAEALFYQAALKQSELNLAYNQRQIKLDKTKLSHASRKIAINVERGIYQSLQQMVKRLEKELPGFREAMAKTKPDVLKEMIG